MQNLPGKDCDVADSKTEYLRGNTTSNDCEALFDKYRTCLTVSDAFCILEGSIGRVTNIMRDL